MTQLMLDDVILSIISKVEHHPFAVGAYDDGTFANSNAAARDFPGAHILTIATRASDRGHCLDIETGDATPADAPGWLSRELAAGNPRPWLYANASTMPSVLKCISHFPRDKYLLWQAQYDDIAEIPADRDAKQYTDRYKGLSLDASVVADYCFGVPKPPPPIDARHYGRLSTVEYPQYNRKIAERPVVIEYDRLRIHPHMHELRLHELRADLRIMADRVYQVSENLQPNPDGTPSWAMYWRGWRFQQLIRRADGERLV